MPGSMYMDIMRHLQNKDLKIVVDATKDLLVNVLQYHPFLIKPNNHELEELFGVTLKQEEDIIVYARKLQEWGSQCADIDGRRWGTSFDGRRKGLQKDAAERECS